MSIKIKNILAGVITLIPGLGLLTYGFVLLFQKSLKRKYDLRFHSKKLQIFGIIYHIIAIAIIIALFFYI